MNHHPHRRLHRRDDHRPLRHILRGNNRRRAQNHANEHANFHQFSFQRKPSTGSIAVSAKSISRAVETQRVPCSSEAFFSMLYLLHARWPMNVQFPLFLLAKDCGELCKFDSIAEMQLKLERIDVENQEYEAWDSNGVEVILSVKEPVWLALTLRPNGSGLNEIRAGVIRYARAVGVTIDDSLPLEVIGATIERIRNEQERKALERSPIRRFFARFR